ncbi:ATP-dependent helicase Lhr and Lhr-like helicase [Butyrivibrio fibrisolvens DSM 3071]|uniref:ATP-dependent helicase Lhr and Lhr-like helicase n=1 Tax=Butyrivibrio fibrisolvens DSM 3071 TaxID=1121131 RepID=A0A1M6BIK8_BUTFI|nr:DEAD/DEAH box helicase [Butyrivibrio fibrisolvens]SHI48562.1 ATP-dependent helicase Lhr and Lhr-like helicase [Butyrivibrio fibrisolvens DSM 3071]
MDVFDRYAPFVQDFIYRNNWESLRAIQVAAGDAIFNTEDNLLLCASTASGKTEAAFFPILTLFNEDPPASVGALYIGPLKALINDQFSRLNDLCAEADIPVWHWHGDVNQSHKNKLLKKPSGILQITPESLEALMLHKHGDIARLFGDLRFIVVDEVHSLMRGDRGGQTLCLMERLSRMAGVNPRRIGLSATIGDLEQTGRFLSSGTGRGCVIPKIEDKGQVWRLSMEHFYIQGPQAGEAATKSKRAQQMEAEGDIIDADVVSATKATSTNGIDSDFEGNVHVSDTYQHSSDKYENISSSKNDIKTLPYISPATDEAPKAADPGMGYIFEHTRGKKCLVFCNSREEAEAVTTTLRQYCEAKHEPERFLIHHGNLSVSYRQTAEEAMKDEESYLTTVTTSTLELGIDIGRLERAFQMDAPFTVSSFLQRMGRTGRRDDPPEMWFVMREDEPEARAMLPETIPWKLLQGIALVQVYIEERWVEPPVLDRLPYSLLYHQTMSTLASGGEMTPGELAGRVLSLSYFHRVSQDDYKILLRHLIEIDHIQQTERGGLIVGLKGERITNSYKFYAVFQENVEYTVRCESQELGTLCAPPPIGEKIAIAGRTWVVEDVDHKRHNVYCQMVKGQVPAYFGECPGDIHTHILERMKKVLLEDKGYPYLMPNAVNRLALGRKSARAAGITDNPLISLGGNMWALFPWLGSYSFLALERFLKIKCAPFLALKGLDSSRPYFIQFTMKADRNTFFEVVCDMADEPLDAMELLYPKEVPVFEKYDDILPEELVRRGFAYAVLNKEEMLDRVRSWRIFIQEKIHGGENSKITDDRL